MVPVPFLTTVSIIDWSFCAFSGDSGCSSSWAWSASMMFRFGATSLSTTYGFISLPSLATAEATIAICSGVAAVSYWPIDGQRDLRRLIWSGKMLAAARTGTSSCSC